MAKNFLFGVSREWPQGSAESTKGESSSGEDVEGGGHVGGKESACM